ncbi:hypothetical protein WJX72_009000 [[Myrmecia] bisecta]|uniref:2-methoxy-6-polyprenyl-1,4-benzoquinol methylase, mitochondrial n=1 Tax=[Myrmecia] bisecta TaxID=41462 RepID=A0AAW1PTZ4_9CHLO
MLRHRHLLLSKILPAAVLSTPEAVQTISLRCFAAAPDPGVASFGFKEVAAEEKVGLVGEVFRSVAPSYDIMNDLMSAGLHRLWKDRLVSKLCPFAGMQHLDVAGGTGDIAFRVLEAIRRAETDVQQQSGEPHPSPGVVTVCDINPAMLEEGKKKAIAAKYDLQGLRWQEGNAEALPFQDHSMDGYTIAFGIRNVTHIDKALQEAHRVLRPGGRFLCLEFSQVVLPGLRELYDLYSMNVIPKIGRVVANDEASYQYLVESIRRFPDQDTFAGMVEDAGLQQVEYENLSGGIVAIHSGFKL